MRINDVGVDVRGAYTDCIAYDKATDTLRIAKVPTVPTNQFVVGVKAILGVRFDPSGLRASTGCFLRRHLRRRT